MRRPRITPFKGTAQERFADYLAEQQAAVENNRRIEMTKRKTAQGDRVPKFPDVSGRGKRIAEVREVLTQAFEKAERAAAMNSRLDAAEKVDTARFPMGGLS